MNELQSKLLEMLTWLTQYLEKNNLRYYVIDGTFLGAARHQGFIPWDDDVDIGMPRRDYEKLLKLLEKPIEHYVVESPRGAAKDYIYGFAKFYDMNTTMTECIHHNVTRGVYIDIFPLDGVGNTKEDGMKYYKLIDRMNMLLAMRVCALRKDRVWWKNIAVILGKILPINGHWLAKKLDALCARRDFDQCKYVANCMSTYRSREIMDKKLLGTPTKYSFESIEVYGPEQCDQYLTHIYKNWRQLPPEDKRHSAHDFINLDLKSPYIK